MRTTHFLNNPSSITHDYTQVFQTNAVPYCSSIPASNIVYRSDLAQYRKNHVCIVAASGSGHEPMFSGLVGPSFISVAVSGGLCAAPSAQQIVDGISLCKGSPGVLLVLSNYTGDRLAAGLALTRVKSNVSLVIVDDDVSIGRKQLGRVGRRGLAGHVLLLKIVSHLAEQGLSLEEVTAAAEQVRGGLGTVGVAFNRCALPTSSVTSIEMLPDNSISLGMGVHGEPGLRNISPVPSPEDLSEEMISLIIDQSDPDRSYVNIEKGDSVVVFVNSLGATEGGILTFFAAVAVEKLKAKGLKVVKVVRGRFVTSFSMSGFSLSLLKVGKLQGVEEALKDISSAI